MPRWLPAIPHIHFMAAASLDAWLRLLLTPGARIPWRYWPRVAVNLALSACVTAITLPERLLLAPVLWWCGRRRGWRLDAGSPAVAPTARTVDGGASDGAVVDRPRDRLQAPPPAIVILGYYRSGTTHLHNLLACDPANHTPRWGQVLSPQGFVLSWFVLKLFLWAVLPTKRPQDDMAFGPEWPGEDDFALSNWTLASPLPGRVILPNVYDHFARYNDLEGLTPRERARWQRTQWAILFKIQLLARGRRLLLKTPPHTAKVPALTDVLGGPGRVKFIHLSREPGAVLKSNQRLMKSMTPMHLQDGPADDVIRERLSADYALVEQRFTAAEPSIPPGDVCRLRYEDLIADPERELRRAYQALGLEWTAGFERPLRAYLASVAEYRSETQKLAPNATADPSAARATPAPSTPGQPRRTDAGVDAVAMRRIARVLITSLAALGFWACVAGLTGHRSAIFAMLAGIALGHAATARRAGSPVWGITIATGTLALSALGMVAATRLADFQGAAPPGLEQLLAAAWRRFSHESTLLWTGLGMLAAYRLGSRRFGVVPGA